MDRRLLLSFLFLTLLILSACEPSQAEVDANATKVAADIFATLTAAPTITPTKTPEPTNTPIPTSTPKPTSTPHPTSTPRPSNTPTATMEPRAATQTALALHREATKAYNQNINDIKKNCPPIDWVELSEVEYAKDHEGECVYIRGQIWDINFDEDLLELSIGYYSAQIAVGLGDLTSTPGRLTEDMWIKVYGRVSTTRWISTNYISGKETPVPGIQALLIEGPNLLVWVHE
ncbi:MAG: hypothetical protein GTO14_09850 [Anaerolineales bacterium]|nr:hypothetical protein [Anaerolineales bacterium]